MGENSYKISKMDMAVRVEQDVVGFDVAVYNVLLVDITKGTTQLRDPEADGIFAEGFARYVEAQVAARHEVDDNVQVFDILEAVTQIAQERMVEMFQHASFSYHVAHALAAYHLMRVNGRLV